MVSQIYLKNRYQTVFVEIDLQKWPIYCIHDVMTVGTTYELSDPAWLLLVRIKKLAFR